MMTRALMLSAILLAPAAPAAVSLQFTAGVNRATNWLDSNGVATTQMVWGIVVDTEGDGFSDSPYVAGFSYESPSTAIMLDSASGPTNDILFLSGNLMSTPPAPGDGAPAGMNLISIISNIPLLDGVGTGDNYRIIWFDQTALAGDAQIGTDYGMYQIPGAFIPADNPVPYNLSANFAGADSPKPMTFALVPEPSHALLGLCGLALLLPRRRAGR